MIDAALQYSIGACLAIIFAIVEGVSINVFSCAFSKMVSSLLELIKSMLTWSLSASTASRDRSSSCDVLSLLVVCIQDSASVAWCFMPSR